MSKLSKAYQNAAYIELHFIFYMLPAIFNEYFFFCPPCRWFSKWQRYVGHSVGMLSTDQQSSDGQHADTGHSEIIHRPGPIDNSDIISNQSNCDGNDLDIRQTLEEEKDYVLVPQEVWERLLEW